MLRKLSQQEINGNMIVQRYINKRDFVRRLSRNNVRVLCDALGQEGGCKLAFYTRKNDPEAWFESGIIFEPGPHCGCSNEFPREMLRVFSKVKKIGLDLVDEYYFKLVLENSFDKAG